MSDDNLKNWTPPKDPNEWGLLDRVRAEKAGLAQLVPGTYEFKMAYWGRTGKWPEMKPASAEEKIRHAEEVQANENLRAGQEVRQKMREDIYKNRMMELAKKRAGIK